MAEIPFSIYPKTDRIRSRKDFLYYQSIRETGSTREKEYRTEMRGYLWMNCAWTYAN